MVEVYFDGLCQPRNPGGIPCYAFIVKSRGATIHRDYGVAGVPFSKEATNNFAEYTGIIKSLEWLVANGFNSEPVSVFSDSKLVVGQLRGEFKIKGKNIIPLYRKVIRLRELFPHFAINWVPREQNGEADSLTNKAYSEALKSNVEYRKRI